jgi:molecular chaperone DnaK
MTITIGIDLGTTNSCVAAYGRQRAPEVIPSIEREPTTPTVVAYTPSGIIAGSPARWQEKTNPENTFPALKRILGRSFDEEIVQRQINTVGYVIEEGPDGEAWVRTREGLKSPAEILSHVLFKLRQTATNYAGGEQVTQCVLTTPAHWLPRQEAALRDAARQAGLEVRLMPAEPRAAAIKYGLERGADKTIAVYDFGGGTFDVSILRVRGRKFSTLATDGDQFLGGEDFDYRIVEWASERFREEHEIELAHNRYAVQRLKEEAEVAKKRLSSAPSYLFSVGSLASGAGGQIDFSVELTQSDLEDMCKDLIERTVEPCERALRKAKLDARDIDDVIMVGGMTAMPRIQQLVLEIFRRQPRADENPDTVVALGAAIQAAALRGQIKSVNFGEKLRSSIGIELGNGQFLPLIKRDSAIPKRTSVTLSTSEDDQTHAAVRFYEGDLTVATDNRHLMTIVVDNIPTGAAGEAQVRVDLDVDQDLMLTMGVSQDGGEAQTTRVHLITGMSDEDLDVLSADDDLAA